MAMRTVYVVVKMYLDDEVASPEEVITECDYEFRFNGEPLSTEIVDLEIK
jgi:hypothetical protein